MNLALGGINLENLGVEKHNGKDCYHIVLNYSEVDYIDTNNKIVFGDKIRQVSDLYIPIESGPATGLEWAQYDPDGETTVKHKLRVLCLEPISGSIVRLNGEQTNELEVLGGTEVKIEVSAPCYSSISYSMVVNSDVYKEVTLIRE